MQRIILIALLFSQCSSDSIPQTPAKTIYLGADLSYVNEMEDCGGTYHLNGQKQDPFAIFAQKKTNLVRVRLWHHPDRTNYSTLDDVKKTIRRSKEQGMQVLLDFHYSDDWADPAHQIVPAAWNNIDDPEILADSMYNYTLNTLLTLHEENLLPDLVQVGNEINSEIMVKVPVQQGTTINWQRNILLINKGLAAVKKAQEMTRKSIQRVIHIAQPENALWWFKEAFANHIADFEWIGLSYYSQWSSIKLTNLPSALDSLKKTYQKRIMVVETAYPYTMQNADSAGNILGNEALVSGYPASPEGQKNYLIALVKKVLLGGGEGVIYWEPAWISTPCHTRWGQGSHWDNAIFFDAAHQNEALPAFDFFDAGLY